MRPLGVSLRLHYCSMDVLQGVLKQLQTMCIEGYDVLHVFPFTTAVLEGTANCNLVHIPGI